MSAYAAADPAAVPHGRQPAGRLTVQLAAAAALVTLADVLFYGRAIGISLVLFLAALAVASFCLNTIRAGTAQRLLAFALLGAGLLPLVEDVHPLSAAIAAVTIAVFARVLAERKPLSWQAHLHAALRLPFSGWFRLPGDLARANRIGKRRRAHSSIVAVALGWAVPLLLCSVFAALFASANPLIDAWLSRINPGAFVEQVVSWRGIFWGLTLCLIWPQLRVRSLRRRQSVEPRQAEAGVEFDPHGILSDLTVRRSLILFNGLFAVQTAMDIAYLWGGVSLPEGVSYASYAHRGAYPLVATALLAAAFVLIAMRPAGPSGRDPLIRPLVLAWVGQNVVLVLSALLRLNLYVAAYSLTSLRLAAFVWMLLVAVGLLLILVQILSRRTIGWLVSANAAALALTLYGYSFVDTPVVIANYNLRHSFEMRGEGQPVDIGYLFSLGPGVIPAVDRYAPRIAAAGHISSTSPWARAGETIAPRRDRLVRAHLLSQADWRGWSFRGWRLSRYLANTPEAPFKAISASPTGASEGR